MIEIRFPHKAGMGGPGSFQRRFEKVLKSGGWKVSYSYDKSTPDIIFIVGGSRKILWLQKMKKLNVPILFRLDGITWLHKKKKTNLKAYLKAEISNLLNKFIHAFIANHIVYQSEFVKNWWKNEGWRYRKNYNIIYNGIDLEEYRPFNDVNKLTIVALEGTIDYSPYAVELLNIISKSISNEIPIKLFGRFENSNHVNQLHYRINYEGSIEREEVPKVLQNSIYLSLDINPACPNTVIEALACGAPVVGFDTGALKELVPPDAGRIVSYGGDPWRCDVPDFDLIIKSIKEIADNYISFSINARKAAEEHFSINKMASDYIRVIESIIA